MLQSITNKTSGWIASIILGLVIVTMSFFGMESYLTGKVETYAAKVEGPAKFLMFGKTTREITQQEFRKRFDQARARQRQTEGDAFDATAFESMANKRQILDEMVDEALLGLVAEKEGVVLSKSAIQKAILEIDAFKSAGHFDPTQYQMALQSQGVSPVEFETLVRADLIQRLIPNQLAASGVAGDAEVDAYVKLAQQTRDIRFLEIPPPATPAAAPNETDLKAWYGAHASQYRSPERLAVEYVELSAAAMPVDSVADEATLRARYESVKTRFGSAEQRMASHILVKLDEKATAAQVAAARKKAQSLADQARLPGADFAALAAANSDDVGSKDAGGDLGPVNDGVFGTEFDTAFNALKVGEVSQPVKLPDGWHVLLYRERIAGNAKPFEDVRAELEAEYLESERERVFNDLSGKLMDKVYADPTDLASSAKELGIPVQRTGLFTAAAGEGVAALAPVRKAAFSDPQKVDRATSDPIEVEPNHIIVLRVTDYQAAAPIPFAQVRDRVLADLSADRLAASSKARAEALLARVNKGESLDVLSSEVGRPVSDVPGVTRQAPNPQLEPLIIEAFRQQRPEAGKPGLSLAKLAPDRYALVSVTAVKDGDPATMDPATRTTIKEQFSKARGAVDAEAFIKGLRKNYSIKVAEDRL